MHPLNLRIEDVLSGRLRVQEEPQIHDESEASLYDMRHYLTENKRSMRKRKKIVHLDSKLP